MLRQLKSALQWLLRKERDDAGTGVTYADLEKDKARKEEQLSGAFPRPEERPA